MNQLRRLGAVGVLVVASAACGGDDPASIDTPDDDPPVTTAATSTTSAAPTPGEWIESTAPLVTDGIATQSDQPVQPPDIHAIGRTSAGWFVVGSVNGGFTVWRSTDLSAFEVVHAEVCCERSVRASAVAELGGAVLIGGTENRPDGSRAAFLWRSDDQGATWAAVHAPRITTDASRVDRIVTIGDTVLVEAVDDRDTSTMPQARPVWSRDLATWNAVDLPGAVAGDWASFVHDDEVVYAVVLRPAADGSFAGWAVWRSEDGGGTFVAAPPAPEATRGAFVVVGGALVALPSTTQTEYTQNEPAGPAVLAPGGDWVALPADTGTWGDGELSFVAPSHGPGHETAYIAVQRMSRASVHYCYDDAQTCQQPEAALLASADGVAWAEVADVPGLDSFGRFGPAAVYSGPDGIELLDVSVEEAAVHVVRWTGTSPPAVTDRPDYPPPDVPVPMYVSGDLEVGTEWRYPLGLGSCAGMYIADQRWAPETPLPDPLPAEWPYRAVEIFDGPDGYLYGRIARTAADTIEFSIEGVGTIAVFHPAPPTETSCG